MIATQKKIEYLAEIMEEIEYKNNAILVIKNNKSM